jgi:hypothetical protein
MIHCGSVTFVQRFGDALNLNVHFHALVPDGVYLVERDEKAIFLPVAPPGDKEVADLAERICLRIGRLLQRRGLLSSEEDCDELANQQPLLSELYSASISGRVATGPRAGHRVNRVGDRIELEDLALGPRCASVAGFSLHANVSIPAHDRMRLERLCRYAARPPVATERLSQLADGRLLYRLKHRWRDGTTHVIYEPLELVAKLAALVPPPRFNLVRYHGVLAPSARWRPEVVPKPEPGETQPHHNCPARKAARSIPEGKSKEQGAIRARYYSWSELLKRVFALDVLTCDHCGGRMRILCAIHPPEAIRKIMECLGVPCRAPPIARASPPAETEDFY